MINVPQVQVNFLEVTINSLGASLDEIDEITEGVEPVKINSMCTVLCRIRNNILDFSWKE